MKTLDTQLRNQLESEILRMLLQRPDMFYSSTLQRSDFSYGVHAKIFDRMSELMLAGKDLSLVYFLSGDYSVSEVTYLFSEELLVKTPSDLKAAIAELKEDVARNSIIRLTQQSGNSIDFLEHIDAMRKISTVYSLDSFEKQFDLYEQEYREIQQRNKEGQAVGLITGYKNFNEKVGLAPCDLCIIGARTSIGKTTFALNVAIEAAAFGQKVLFVSMEMPRKQIFDKICARLMRQPISSFKYGRTNLSTCKNELKAIASNFYFVFAPSCTSNDVQSIASLMPSVDLIIVDYLQLLKDAPQKGETENLRLGRITGKLKMIAGRANCTLIAPAQLNRESEKQEREPRLSDLRDSGCIEQDADQVLFLHRVSRESTLAKIIIAKNRHGALDEIQFNFNPSWGWFEEDNDYAIQTKETNITAKSSTAFTF